MRNKFGLYKQHSQTLIKEVSVRRKPLAAILKPLCISKLVLELIVQFVIEATSSSDT